MPSEVQTKNTNTVSLDEIEEKSKLKIPPAIEKPKDAAETAPILNNKNIKTKLFGDIVRPEPNSKKNEQFTVQKSIDMIRNLVKELNKHGVNADIDEMNFSKSYQIIIKLDKTAE